MQCRLLYRYHSLNLLLIGQAYRRGRGVNGLEHRHCKGGSGLLPIRYRRSLLVQGLHGGLAISKLIPLVYQTGALDARKICGVILGRTFSFCVHDGLSGCPVFRCGRRASRPSSRGFRLWLFSLRGWRWMALCLCHWMGSTRTARLSQEAWLCLSESDRVEGFVYTLFYSFVFLL